jgi:hypothetical protein
MITLTVISLIILSLLICYLYLSLDKGIKQLKLESIIHINKLQKGKEKLQKKHQELENIHSKSNRYTYERNRYKKSGRGNHKIKFSTQIPSELSDLRKKLDDFICEARYFENTKTNNYDF